MNQATNFNPPLAAGDYVNATGDDVPNWAVVDKHTGKVITLANTRYYAREFADHTKGERIAKVHSVTYEVKK